MTTRIKDSYQKHLWLFLSANIVIYLVVYSLKLFDLNEANLKLSEFLNPKSFLFILSPTITLILNGLLPNAIKEFLVFWKVKNRLPGYRAFSKFASSDYRININNLRNVVGNFQDLPSEQNRVWYKLYSGIRDNGIIRGSHRDFLLTRDLCAISFLFAASIIPIELYSLKNINTKTIYTLFLLVQYMIISISARNYGNRFVCNVLTVTSNNA